MAAYQIFQMWPPGGGGLVRGDHNPNSAFTWNLLKQCADELFRWCFACSFFSSSSSIPFSLKWNNPPHIDLDISYGHTIRCSSYSDLCPCLPCSSGISWIWSVEFVTQLLGLRARIRMSRGHQTTNETYHCETREWYWELLIASVFQSMVSTTENSWP